METRAMMSATAASDLAALLANAKMSSNGDMTVPVHVQVGSTAIEKVLGIAETFDTIESAVNAYLGSVPGWHLTGGIDTTPTYSATIDGSIVVSSLGVLKSASVSLTASGDIGGAIEGYYGISVLHIGIGTAIDLSANVSAAASYSISTNSWYFGGSTSLDGSAKGYASAMAWPVKGEIYVAGNVAAAAAISSSTGIATASISLTGTVGADAQLKSLFGGWSTIASVSRNLGSWHCSESFDVGSWLKSQVGDLTTSSQSARVALATSAAAQAASSSVAATSVASTGTAAAASSTASDTDTITLVAQATVASSTNSSSSVQLGSSSLLTSKSTSKVDARSAALATATALEQLAVAGVLGTSVV